MSKMGLHDHLGSWNISYGQKNGRESNWQFDSWPLKVDNRLHFLTWKWRATYRWKDLDKGYNFASDLTSIEGLKIKLWSSKVAKVPILIILGLPLGSSEQNDIRVLAPWPSTKCTIRGKVVASPRSKLWWILWVRVCLWLVRALKCSNYALKKLIVCFVQVCVNNWLLVNLPSPIPELQHTPLPPRCCEPGNVPQLLLLSLFSPLDS